MDEFQVAVLEQLGALTQQVSTLAKGVAALDSRMEHMESDVGAIKSRQAAHTRQLDTLYGAVADIRETLATKADKAQAV